MLASTLVCLSLWFTVKDKVTSFGQSAINWLEAVCRASNMYDIHTEAGKMPLKVWILTKTLSTCLTKKANGFTKRKKGNNFDPQSESKSLYVEASSEEPNSNLTVTKLLRGELFSFRRLVIMSFGNSQPSTFPYRSTEKSRFALWFQVKRKQKVVTLGLSGGEI